MNILICHRPGGAFGYITDSWINCLRDKGHDVRRWDGTQESWRAFRPHLYIGASGHKQPIPPQHGAKIALHVNPYGPVAIDGINESPDSIKWTLAQKPNAVFGYGQEDDRLLWSYWTTRHGIPWVPMPTAADRTFFKEIVPLDQRQYDVVYLGGYWQYKGTTLDAYLLPILMKGEMSYKLHGWGHWPTGVCSGILPDDQATQFLNSGRVGPCVSERHTHSHGIDIPERVFKTILCGLLAVHDAVPALRKMLPSIVLCQTPEQFYQECLYYSRPENFHDRLKIVRQQQAEVLAAHTYHHRLAKLFETLGWVEEAISMVN